MEEEKKVKKETTKRVTKSKVEPSTTKKRTTKKSTEKKENAKTVEKKAPRKKVEKKVLDKIEEPKKEEKIEIPSQEEVKKEENVVKKQTEPRKKSIFTSTEVLILLLLTCLISILMGMIISGSGMNSSDFAGEGATKDKKIEEFIKNYNYILEHYYGELNPDDLIDSAIEGMLSSIDDPYTGYMNETASDRFNKELTGSYRGLGVEISVTKEDGVQYIYIVRVMKNSPAEEAGLQENDLILKVDSMDLVGKESTDLTTYVKENVQEEYQLEIKRGEETIQKTVKSQTIILESVESKIYERNGKKIGYLSVNIFAANTYNQFKEELKKLEEQNIDSLIIDVRGNSGGHLSSVKYMASLFLDSNKLIYQTKTKTEIVKTHSLGTTTVTYPVALLVDGGSASASELLTAALQENKVATVIGTTTYGKGTVQELVELGDGTQYKFTTKEWLTPLGNSINEKGITPDIILEFDSLGYLQNPTDEGDNQLQRALEEMSK